MSARHLQGHRPMNQRQRLEAAVEHALRILDLLDGDENFEPDNDGEEEPIEHSLGPVVLDRRLAEELRP